MKKASLAVIVLSLGFFFLAVLVISNGARRADGAWPFGKREKASSSDSVEQEGPQRALPRRYAKVALSKDESKVLFVVFEASRGTASGYDTVYADFDSSVNLERAKKLIAKSQKQPRRIVCPFPSLDLNLPSDEKPGEISASCSISFCYCTQSQVENFCVTASTTLRQGSTKWQYSSRGSVKPSESAEKAPLLELNKSPEILITTKPDLEKKGNLGIALALMTGEAQTECNKEGAPLDAHIEIKTAGEKVVHQDTQVIDKFAFG